MNSSRSEDLGELPPHFHRRFHGPAVGSCGPSIYWRARHTRVEAAERVRSDADDQPGDPDAEARVAGQGAATAVATVAGLPTQQRWGSEAGPDQTRRWPRPRPRPGNVRRSVGDRPEPHEADHVGARLQQEPRRHKREQRGNADVDHSRKSYKMTPQEIAANQKKNSDIANRAEQRYNAPTNQAERWSDANRAAGIGEIRDGRTGGAVKPSPAPRNVTIRDKVERMNRDKAANPPAREPSRTPGGSARWR
jgi:hypothetical protein